MAARDVPLDVHHGLDPKIVAVKISLENTQRNAKKFRNIDV